MGRDIVKWTDPLWSTVSPKSFSTYFAKYPVSPQFADKIAELAPGASLVVGYGSQFSYEPGRTSKMRDLIIFVEGDTRAFHEHNTSVRGRDYGMGPNVRLHTFLNGIGINFYKTDLEGSAKYGVIGTELAAHNAGLDGPDGQYTPIGNLYDQGRMHKRFVNLAQTQGAGLDIASQAINKARIDGVTLAFSRTRPDQAVGLKELAYGVSRLSYDADIRLDNPNKAKIQVDANWDDWQPMLLPIINQMIDLGIVEQTGADEYVAKVVIPSETTQRLIQKSQAFAFGSNYLKNWVTFGPVRGPIYAGSKAFRSLPAIYEQAKELVLPSKVLN